MASKLNLVSIKRTSIVCTIGPASWDYSTMKKLAEVGMDVVRLNMSHGNYEEKSKQIEQVRKISKELNKPLAIIADLQGPKIRLGKIGEETGGKDEKVEINKDQIVRLTINPQAENEYAMQFDLSPFVKVGHRVFLNDGLIEVKVLKIIGNIIETKALNDGVISSNKGVNIPDTNLKGAAFTDKDYRDAEFALKEKVDYVAMSFVQNPEDLKTLKDLIKKHYPKAKIISKIEKNEAITNLEKIIQISDAIMVARGDLAIETSAYEVPILQQRMIKLCRQYQKPVIVATQMLESMTENPRPTRAEASDVANAVMDQVDGVMLSAESASGKYPVETVSTMAHIIESVENDLYYKRYIRIDWEHIEQKDFGLNAITSSAASIAHRINAKAIVAGTTTGRTARILSSFRPDSHVIAIVHDQETYNQLALVWGVTPIVVKPTRDFNKFLRDINSAIKSNFKKGDQIVVVTGNTAGQSGATSTIKISTF